MTLLLLALTVPPAPAPRAVGELVELATPTGTLSGTLDLPPGRPPFPAVLLHAGSGPTDRDGNQRLLRNDSLKMLGRALAARGVAVLRVDKRGIAASAKAMTKEEDLRLDTYAADAAAWAAWLRADGRFGRVGIVGHSEGALIGALAADAKADAFVSLCGPGRPLQDVLREQLRKNLPKEQADQSETILDELAAGRLVKDVPTGLGSLFRPSVQPYLISSFRRDPAKLVAALKVPVLVVSGTTDIQVPADDGKRLAAARPGVRHVVIADMNHVLKEEASTDRLRQIPTYTDPSRPLHPKLAGALAGFLNEVLAR